MVGDTPIMYQDLASYTMSPMAMPMMPMGFGGITGTPYQNQTGSNTSYLGGTQMKPQLDNDKVELMNKKSNEGISTAKKVGIALAALFAIGFIPKLAGKQSVFSKAGNWATKKYPKLNNAKTWITNKWNTFTAFCSKHYNSLKSKFTKSAP